MLTLAVASMFSGSTSVLSSPISCTAPPSSGSVSQIMCSMIRLINKISCRKKAQVRHGKVKNRLYHLVPLHASLQPIIIVEELHLY